MTSAHKALILVAGPSHELSLKGFMTVRKWIDRSIAGVETRSGDYPVMNTKNVAIIIMLSGLENIPRITELKEIQNQYKTHLQEGSVAVKQSGSYAISVSEGTVSSSSVGKSTKRQEAKVKDETLILPFTANMIKESPQGDSGGFSDQAKKDYPLGIEALRPPVQRKISLEPDAAEKKASPRHITKPHIIEEVIPQLPANEMSAPKTSDSHITHHRVVVARDHADQTAHPAPHSTFHESSVHGIPQGKKSSYAKDSTGFDEKHLPNTSDDRLRTKGTERQIIERELQRQRMMAISGRTPKTVAPEPSHPTPTPEIVRFKRVVIEKTSLDQEHEPSDPDEVVHPVHRKRTVVIQKKKVRPVSQDTPVPEEKNGEVSVEGDDLSVIRRPEVNSRPMDSEDSKVSIKNSAHVSKDKIFEGKGVQRPVVPQARDSALIHTNLKSKKTLSASKDVESDPDSNDHVTESSRTSKKREKNTPKKDDISWI